MIKTLGLNHIALPVKDVNRPLLFYQKVSGVKKMYRPPEFIKVQTASSKEAVVLGNRKKPAPKRTGLYVGFRLTHHSGIKTMIRTVENTGRKLKSDEFALFESCICFFMAHGYEIMYSLKNPSSHKSFN
jgi:hypothetical protein